MAQEIRAMPEEMDPELWRGFKSPTPAWQGRVAAIFVTPESSGEMVSLPAVRAFADRGLEGDRFFRESWDAVNRPDKAITLIEAEIFESQAAQHGLDLNPWEARRQVLVRGIDLGDFIGRRFQVGDLECEGEERCEPCNHLAKLVGTQVVLKGLLHSGLRARILKGGTIRIGDEVQLSAEQSRAVTLSY